MNILSRPGRAISSSPFPLKRRTRLRPAGRSFTPSAMALLLVLAVAPRSTLSAAPGQAPETLRAKLTVNENEAMWNFWSAETDKAKIDKALADRKVKLPPRLSPKAVVTMTLDEDAVIMVFDKSGDGKTIRAWVDTNQNNDLTDETPFEFPAEDSGDKPAIQFRIQRFFGPDKSRSVWRPYFVIHDVVKDKKTGRMQEYYGYTGHYVAEGVLEVGGKPLKIRMWDLTADGKFDRKDLTQGSTISLDLNGDGEYKGANEYYWGYELFPLAGAYYKIEELAEDGTRIVFRRTDLKPAEFDRPAPDFELRDTKGKFFRLSDYKDRVLLVDFWPSWCQPCVENFPKVKEMVQRYRGKAFDVVGINLDDAKRLSNAFKIIEKYGLDWRQVADGKGDFQPIWQVYGVLPENRMAFPLYVVIDAGGIVRAGTNDLAKAGKVLDGLLTR